MSWRFATSTGEDQGYNYIAMEFVDGQTSSGYSTSGDECRFVARWKLSNKSLWHYNMPISLYFVDRASAAYILLLAKVW